MELGQALFFPDPHWRQCSDIPVLGVTDRAKRVVNGWNILSVNHPSIMSMCKDDRKRYRF